jgi:hypothetical protein
MTRSACFLTGGLAALPSTTGTDKTRDRLRSLGVFPLATRRASVLEGGGIARASFMGHDGCCLLLPQFLAGHCHLSGGLATGDHAAGSAPAAPPT